MQICYIICSISITSDTSVFLLAMSLHDDVSCGALGTILRKTQTPRAMALLCIYSYCVVHTNCITERTSDITVRNIGLECYRAADCCPVNSVSYINNRVALPSQILYSPNYKTCV